LRCFIQITFGGWAVSVPWRPLALRLRLAADVLFSGSGYFSQTFDTRGVEKRPCYKMVQQVREGPYARSVPPRKRLTLRTNDGAARGSTVRRRMFSAENRRRREVAFAD